MMRLWVVALLSSGAVGIVAGTVMSDGMPKFNSTNSTPATSQPDFQTQTKHWTVKHNPLNEGLEPSGGNEFHAPSQLSFKLLRKSVDSDKNHYAFQFFAFSRLFALSHFLLRAFVFSFSSFSFSYFSSAPFPQLPFSILCRRRLLIFSLTKCKINLSSELKTSKQKNECALSWYTTSLSHTFNHQWHNCTHPTLVPTPLPLSHTCTFQLSHTCTQPLTHMWLPPERSAFRDLLQNKKDNFFMQWKDCEMGVL